MHGDRSEAAAKILLLTQLLEQARDALERTDEQRRRVASIVESHDKLVAHKEGENARLREHLSELEHGAQLQMAMERQLGAAKAEVARLTAENIALKQEIKGLTKRVSNLSDYKHQVVSLANELADIKRSMEKQSEEAAQANAELAAVSEANKRLQASSRMLSDKLVVLLAASLDGDNESESGTFVDRRQLYLALMYQASFLEDLSTHFRSVHNAPGDCGESPMQTSPLAAFITIHSVAIQRILLRRLSEFIEKAASEQVDTLDQLDLLLSAFVVTLAEYYLAAFMASENHDYFLLNPKLRPAVLDTVSGFICALKNACGDLLTAMGEAVMLSTAPLHTQFSFHGIKGLSTRLLPILLSNMDLLGGQDTGIHMHASNMIALLPIERLIFAAVSFTKRATSLRLKRPFAAISSRQFYRAIRSMCAQDSGLDSNDLCCELTIDQMNLLLRTCSDLLSKGAGSALEALITDTRADLSQYVNGDVTAIRTGQTLPSDGAIDEELLGPIRHSALQQLIDYPQKHSALLHQLDLKDKALNELQGECSKLMGLLKLNSDRVTITEETNVALRNALSAKLIT